MKKARTLLGWLLFGFALEGCNATVVDAPYESCTPGEICHGGTQCLPTTLPASAGFTGYLCTNSCATSVDCLQDLSNYAAICVNAQCYIQCPNGGASCPYGTGCVTFQDQAGFAVNICTP
jgi:hypothetical protein